MDRRRQNRLFDPPDDVEVIADRVRRAVTDDDLVDKAADLNWKMVVDRLDGAVLRKAVIGDYQRLLGYDSLRLPG